MTKKELLKRIERIEKELKQEVMHVDGENNKKNNNNFKLLLDYLGLELTVEKSIEPDYYYDYLYNKILNGKDKIVYTDKIVKKSKKSKK